MNEKSLLFDNKNTIIQKYVISVIAHLVDLTQRKTQNEVGIAFGFVNGVCVSQMKNGQISLKYEHLAKFATAYKFFTPALITYLDEKILQKNSHATINPLADTLHIATSSEESVIVTTELSTNESTQLDKLQVEDAKPDEQRHIAPALAQPVTHEFIDTVIPERSRQPFLIGLQGLLEINEGVLFNKKINEGQIDPQRTNCAAFLIDGRVPAHWIAMIADPHKAQILLERHVVEPRQSPPSAGTNGPVAQRSVHATEKTHPNVVSHECKKPSDLPAEYFDAFFTACVAAGKALHLNSAFEVFLGTLVTQLPSCTVSCKSLTDRSPIALITIHNGKTIITYHLDPKAVFV